MRGSWNRLPVIIRENRATFLKLLLFSIILFVAGIGSFLVVSKTTIADGIVSSQGGRDTIGAIVSVLVVNFVIALYVVSAFNEPEEDASSLTGSTKPPPPAMPPSMPSVLPSPAYPATELSSDSSAASSGEQKKSK